MLVIARILLVAVSCTAKVLPALTKPFVLLIVPLLVKVVLLFARIAPVVLSTLAADKATLLPSRP